MSGRTRRPDDRPVAEHGYISCDVRVLIAVERTTVAREDHRTMPHQKQTNDVEFDLAYIDMMIPHHESLIALSKVAEEELSDPELVEMARSLVSEQGHEVERMKRLRKAWYGEAPEVPMDVQMQQMPHMEGDMESMHDMMSADWMIQTFREARNKDLSFIDQTIPHHRMAIDGSADAVERAVHVELGTIARNVITAQQRDIAMMKRIRSELTGEGVS